MQLKFVQLKARGTWNIVIVHQLIYIFIRGLFHSFREMKYTLFQSRKSEIKFEINIFLHDFSLNKAYY